MNLMTYAHVVGQALCDIQTSIWFLVSMYECMNRSVVGRIKEEMKQ